MEVLSGKIFQNTKLGSLKTEPEKIYSWNIKNTTLKMSCIAKQ